MRMPTLLTAAACAALGVPALGATQPDQSRHLQVHTIQNGATRAALTDPASFQAVRIGDLVEMPVTLQDGTPINLELERFNPFTAGAKIVTVDASGAEHAIDLSNDVHLRGHVVGDESQTAYVAVTAFGTSGYIEFNGQPQVISAGKYTGQSKSANDLFVFPADMLNLETVGQNCAVDVNNPRFNPLGLQIAPDRVNPDDQVAPQGPPPRRQAVIALDTDYEFSSQLFGGNTTASASYASSLIAAISTIYDRDVNMTLAISFLRTYETNNDPYGGSSIGDFLDDVQNEFNTGDEADIERTNVHAFSARNLGGGVAYFPTTCDDFWSIGVSANMDGFFPNPLQDNSHNNWDVVVVAHELGHNFGTGHTHDSYDPPIDGCGNGDCTLSQDATIMSYCHTCSGGLSNIDLRFHPRVQAAILDYLGNVAPCDLTVPELCQADLNLDGELDFLDISSFIGAYNAHNPLADWNHDDQYDFLDISGFLAGYSAGCP